MFTEVLGESPQTVHCSTADVLREPPGAVARLCFTRRGLNSSGSPLLTAAMAKLEIWVDHY